MSVFDSITPPNLQQRAHESKNQWSISITAKYKGEKAPWSIGKWFTWILFVFLILTSLKYFQPNALKAIAVFF